MAGAVSRVPNPLDWLQSQHRGWLQHPTSQQSPTIIWPRMTRPAWPTPSSHWSIWRTVCTQSWIMCLTSTHWQQSIPNCFWSNQHDRTSDTWQDSSKGNGVCPVPTDPVATYFNHAFPTTSRKLCTHKTLMPKTVLHSKAHISKKTQPKSLFTRLIPQMQHKQSNWDRLQNQYYHK